MRAVVRTEVEIEAPAAAVWDYVTDWPRQGEWIPLTRVEDTGADRVGEEIRAWTGLGSAGFWDTMTITSWETGEDGSGRCEVLHTGRVVRGDGEFAVRALGPERCVFTWGERLVVPGGPLGAIAWRLVGPLVHRGVTRALGRLARQVERSGGVG